MIEAFVPFVVVASVAVVVAQLNVFLNSLRAFMSTRVRSKKEQDKRIDLI